MILNAWMLGVLTKGGKARRAQKEKVKREKEKGKGRKGVKGKNKHSGKTDGYCSYSYCWKYCHQKDAWQEPEKEKETNPRDQWVHP